MRVEAVVVLRDAQFASRGLVAGARQVASLPPRLLVLEVDEASLEALALHPAVAFVARAGLQATDPGVVPPLNEAEALFLAAFAAKGSKSGARPGQGLAWDAAGFDAPGRPRR